MLGTYAMCQCKKQIAHEHALSVLGQLHKKTPPQALNCRIVMRRIGIDKKAKDIANAVAKVAGVKVARFIRMMHDGKQKTCFLELFSSQDAYVVQEKMDGRRILGSTGGACSFCAKRLGSGSPRYHGFLAPPPPRAWRAKETGQGERETQGEVTGQGRPRSPKMVHSAERGKGKDKREKIIVVVRSPCQETYTADAHTSTHKSVLQSANPAWTRSVHLDAPGQWHGQ